jgi:hypothetical protein
MVLEKDNANSVLNAHVILMAEEVAPGITFRRSKMILRWFDAEEAKKFGASLASFFIDRLPLDTLGKKSKSLTRKQEVLNKMFLQIVRFNAEHKLNIYKKAQFGNTFKWTLKDAGYDPAFVDQLTKELMLKF